MKIYSFQEKQQKKLLDMIIKLFKIEKINYHLYLQFQNYPTNEIH